MFKLEAKYEIIILLGLSLLVALIGNLLYY